MTTTELVDLLRHAYDGDPWHGPSLKKVLSNVTADTADARPLNGRHSIWEIVLHATGWTREVDRRLNGGRPTQPAEGDWPTPPARPTGIAAAATWQEALRNLEQAHESLVATVVRTPDQRWEEMVGDQRDAAEGTGITFGVMVVGLATHHAYHAGQIAMLTPRAA